MDIYKVKNIILPPRQNIQNLFGYFLCNFSIKKFLINLLYESLLTFNLITTNILYNYKHNLTEKE